MKPEPKPGAPPEPDSPRRIAALGIAAAILAMLVIIVVSVASHF